ncbi:MAG: hypothetical protein JSW47_22585, partial [Phycisphaerales bacterium]
GQFTIPEEPNSVIHFDIEVEAKDLYYGRAVYDDDMPVERGGYRLWFELYGPEKRLQYHTRGEGFGDRIDPNGFFRVALSQKEREELIRCTGGNVEISDRSGTIGQVHISKLSRNPEDAPTLTFSRKSPRTTLVGSRLPSFEDIAPVFRPGLRKDKAILICFFDLNQRPSRHLVRQLSTKAAELAEEDVAVFLVQTPCIGKESLNTWVKENGVSFPIGTVQGDGEKTRFNWGVKSLPWLILADRNHRVIAEGFGLNELEDKLKEANNVEQ